MSHNTGRVRAFTHLRRRRSIAKVAELQRQLDDEARAIAFGLADPQPMSLDNAISECPWGWRGVQRMMDALGRVPWAVPPHVQALCVGYHPSDPLNAHHTEP